MCVYVGEVIYVSASEVTTMYKLPLEAPCIQCYICKVTTIIGADFEGWPS